VKNPKDRRNLGEENENTRAKELADGAIQIKKENSVVRKYAPLHERSATSKIVKCKLS
jgi:hypothetical protein